MIEKRDLLKIANWEMPFGKYRGRVLIDLPESYLLWFTENGFPEGELGKLMAYTLQLKIDGLEGVVKPLKGNGTNLKSRGISGEVEGPPIPRISRKS